MDDVVIARRAGLPVRGSARGVITLIQEQRFRVEDSLGRGYLFTLGKAAGASTSDLYTWSGQKVPVTVDFEGPPDLGAIAVNVRASARG